MYTTAIKQQYRLFDTQQCVVILCDLLNRVIFGYQCNYGTLAHIKRKKRIGGGGNVKKSYGNTEKRMDEQLRKRDDKNKWWLEKNRQSPLNLCSTVNTLERLMACVCVYRTDGRMDGEKGGSKRERLKVCVYVSVWQIVTGTGKQLRPQWLRFLVRLHIQSWQTLTAE